LVVVDRLILFDLAIQPFIGDLQLKRLRSMMMQSYLLLPLQILFQIVNFEAKYHHLHSFLVVHSH
jgi:hypothetical protein